MYRKQIIVLLACAASALPALPQEPVLYRNEFTVQALGSFLKTTNDNGSQQSATNSGGVLGSYRLFFNSYNRVEVNYGYTLNTQTYLLPSSSIGVKSYSHEISGAYVVRKPYKRWTPFALAGVGGLVFEPKDTPGVNSQASGVCLWGRRRRQRFQPLVCAGRVSRFCLQLSYLESAGSWRRGPHHASRRTIDRLRVSVLKRRGLRAVRSPVIPPSPLIAPP